MPFSHTQQATALDRLKGLTTLPDHRVREILSAALQYVETQPTLAQTQPLERAFMLACQQVWEEEAKVKGMGGSGGVGGNGTAHHAPDPLPVRDSDGRDEHL